MNNTSIVEYTDALSRTLTFIFLKGLEALMGPQDQHVDEWPFV